jgi:TRAP-type uncharacterized transport system fused permease subunit
VAVCAAAGIITATTTKTGLGAQFASLLVRGAQALADDPTVVLALTVVFAAVALSLLGLAVPVTASFIIGWVIIGPALLALGVPAPAAAMFVFYYSVLSEVTPPTALAAVGAAAITGGRTVPTMWQALKYALPAFLAPIAFVLTGPGEYLLGRGSPLEVLWAGLVGCLGVAALAVATGGWLLGVGPAGPVERVLTALAGLLLLYLHPVSIAIGVALIVIAVLIALARRRRTVETGPDDPASEGPPVPGGTTGAGSAGGAEAVTGGGGVTGAEGATGAGGVTGGDGPGAGAEDAGSRGQEFGSSVGEEAK